MSDAPRATLQLTELADGIATEIKNTLGFDEKVDVARLGLAYALAIGISFERNAEGLGSLKGSTYNIRTLDNDGELEQLLRAMHPDFRGDVGDAFHVLVNRGIAALGELPPAYSVSELLGTVLTASPVSPSVAD